VLAANQVGVSKSIIVVRYDGIITPYINPVILAGEGLVTLQEGCLSNQATRSVNRYAYIQFQGYIFDSCGHWLQRKVEQNNLGHVIQHEMDHLAGIPFSRMGVKSA
jgi:peptide deformylase